MSINSERINLAKALGKTYVQEYYVFLEPSPPGVGGGEVKELIQYHVNSKKDMKNIVLNKSIGNEFYEHVYVRMGDWDPYTMEGDVIHPDNIKSIVSKIRIKKDDGAASHSGPSAVKLACGFIMTRILMYRLLVNAYTLNNYSYSRYLDDFVLDSAMIANFMSKVEFHLPLDKNIQLLLSKILTPDNLVDVIMFKHGYLRFPLSSLSTIFQIQPITKQFQIYKITENMDIDEMVECMGICIDNSIGAFGGPQEMFTVKRYQPNRNILVKLLSHDYESEDSHSDSHSNMNLKSRVKEVIDKYLMKGGNKNIKIDDYFSEKDEKIFYANRLEFLGY